MDEKEPIFDTLLKNEKSDLWLMLILFMIMLPKEKLDQIIENWEKENG